MPEWAPLVDISEDDKEYLIKAELPEVKKEDVKVRGQFDSCWKCGPKRETAIQLDNEGEDNENISRFVD